MKPVVIDRLEDLKWEECICPLCGTSESQTVLMNKEPLTEGQFGYKVHPVICTCGLVYLNPRWDAPTYSRFYKNYYDDLYRLDEKEDYGIEGIKRNTKEIFNRISQYIELIKPKNIIDVGCGSGAGFLYLNEVLDDVKYYGVESSEDSIQKLEKMGVKVVDSDLEGDWTKTYNGFFDLLIMRHVVEHILHPIDALTKIAKTLHSDGIAYIAVPDMMRPRVKLRDYEKWWEYYFRAVHPYYYSKETLFTLLNMCGLEVLAFGEENDEIWCVVNTKITNQGSKERTNSYDEQIRVLEKYLP